MCNIFDWSSNFVNKKADVAFGEVPEWPNGAVSKTVAPLCGALSSNLSLSVMFL